MSYDVHSGLVQLQSGTTLIISRSAFPVFLKVNRCFTISPCEILPNWYTAVSKAIMGSAGVLSGIAVMVSVVKTIISIESGITFSDCVADALKFCNASDKETESVCAQANPAMSSKNERSIFFL